MKKLIRNNLFLLLGVIVLFSSVYLGAYIQVKDLKIGGDIFILAIVLAILVKISTSRFDFVLCVTSVYVVVVHIIAYIQNGIDFILDVYIKCCKLPLIFMIYLVGFELAIILLYKTNSTFWNTVHNKKDSDELFKVMPDICAIYNRLCDK